MAIAWLVIAYGAGMVVLQILQDRVQYPRFKAMAETSDRQRMFRYWIVDAFFRYGVMGVVALFLLARQDALMALPADIAAARDAFAARAGLGDGEVRQLGVTLTLALSAGVLIGGLLPFVVKPKSGKAAVVGDITPLMPRNGAEMRLTALLSVNAGVTEEIFFRMAVPFAAFAITQNLALAFGMAALLFGLVHAYQGAVGIIATFVVGAVLTLLYLASGQIWLVIGLHALIDIRALVLTPLALRAVK